MILTQTADTFMDPIENFITVYENEPVITALTLLKKSLHQGSAWRGPRLLVVINDQEQPVGLVTLKSLLNALEIKSLDENIDFKSESFSWYHIHEIRNQGIPVREVMRPLNVFTIDRQKSNQVAVHFFSHHGVNYLPVMDGDKVIGILNVRDLFFKIYDETHFRLTLESQLNESLFGFNPFIPIFLTAKKYLKKTGIIGDH